jgi:two-component system, sensor histidine kinase and response regulator
MPSSRPRATDRPAVTAESPVAILVVDDNAAKRLALKAALLPLGYPVVEADSGRAALRRIMAQDFAVILLDVYMPTMDGFETAALIRQRRESEMTPIIFITANLSDEIVKADRYVEGAVDFMFAPVPPDELRAKVSVFASLFIKAEILATQAREVQTSADQLRMLTEAAPIGIFQTDSQNRYVYTNPRWTEITGIPPEEAAGQPWDTIIGSEQRAGLLAELADGAIHRSEFWHRFEIRRAGSAPRIVLVTSRSIPDVDGGIAGWVGTLADVTAEAEAEAALSDARDKATEASRLKSDFLVNMSHEIRTPMNGVIGMTDLLLETDLDPRQRDYAQTVRNSGEALLTIINDILDFSKVEAGKLEIEDIEFNLRTIVDDVVDLLAGPAQTKGLELTAVIESSVPAVVSGDPGRLRQVLTNLIGNAIKFTTTGEIVLRVTAADVPVADTIVRFAVSDTGDGIAPDKLDTIFLPFVQADTSTSRKYGGTGLGLAISGQLVALMGGECGVSSRLGEGSNFWFTICVHADPGQAEHRLVSTDAGLAGVTALIVDDNTTQLGVLSAYLRDWGMIVSTADSGEAALAMLRTAATEGRPFAVALLDRFMPGMDGLELKNAIALDPALGARLVLMTGLGQERDLGDDTEFGVCASLSKPIRREDLRACLRVALGLQVAEVAVASREVTAEGRSSAGELEMGLLLLAEDNLINQKVALAILRNAGYRVDTVLNGAAAVEAAGARRYDAILMDCQMPELNGYEATAAIRAQEGSGRRTPIIAMTAGARREDQERCLAEGMDSYLAKPVNKDALLALLARWARGGSEPTIAVDPSEPRPAKLVGMDHRADPVRPVLDARVVGRLERLGQAAGEDLMGQLAVLFLADADARVAALRQALAGDDAGAVVRSAHTLSGASANLGAIDLARLCATLATDSAAGDLAGGGALLEAVETELGRVRAALGGPFPTS